ncbi:Nitrogen permease regulator 3 [Cladophialophora chaetospira]|uniref:Nitrogen permease regulator 3 n=1 Tax=Cladophialophora chaetospira TaxID=386627 RepID=A0AA38XAM8_9EURO|nr:Nitrogen permease regulator 3 [Cladophialophora chaetospira]
MSASTTSPNPSLLAVLLIVQGRTGSGAEIVYHYPPDPLSAARPSYTSESTDEDDEESSSSDSEESSSEDDFDLFTNRLRNGLTGAQSQDNQSQNSDDEENNYLSKRGTRDNGQWKPQWEPLLGLGEDGLVSLLAPGRAWHKRRFELGINEMTFLGRPVYAREDGFWRKARKKSAPAGGDEHTLSEPNVGESGTDEDEDEDESGGLSSDRACGEKSQHAKELPKSQLTMFHLVFVMDPSPLEHTVRVKEMYDHVVKKLSKVLKWAQAHHNYVWEQAELLQSIRSTHFQQQSSAKALYTDMKQRSSLASAMTKVFENISESRIAAITLTPKLSVSLQIPPITSSAYLPSLSEPPLQPGLWLTTSTDTIAASELDTPASTGPVQLSKNFTLLLKSSQQKIIKDIQTSGSSLTMPLANFVTHLKPTKSFYKISINSQIPYNDIQHLAHHLIYWRKAIAIPPLHQRDTYIVSPNANMSKLASACKAYEATFPMMPSLPKMLSALSGTPAPFGTLIPSTDHKEEYYRVLAWLMRDGWVTQLRTFAFVRVDPEVKKAVREKDREEARGTKTPIEREFSDVAKSFGSGTPTTNASGALSSFKQRPSMMSRPSSDGRQSISTDGTSMRAAQQLNHNPKAASLILSPQRASPEESRWLDHIASTITSRSPSRSDLSASPTTSYSDHEVAEVRRYWPLFVKYFTGLEALERIPVREGLKRKLVWDTLGRMGLDFDGGVEDERGENKKVLMTIRHW